MGELLLICEQETLNDQLQVQVDKHQEIAHLLHGEDNTREGSMRPSTAAGTPQPRVSLKLGARRSRGGTESRVVSDDEDD